jgi:tetratricopeptide (TPR) repeat protein
MGIIFPQQAKFDSLVFKGINRIYNIKFDEAERVFHTVMADYPNHPAGRFFLAMIDWWKIMLDVDNESYDDMFFAKLEDVIYQCDQILEKDPSNVDALFFKGGAIGFRGRLRAFRESWIKAADDGREALPIVNRAYKLNPDNIDVQLGFGIYNYYASVIPQKYPIVKPLMIFFPSGDKDKGLKELADVALRGKYARTESRYFLMQLYYQFEENFQKAEEYSRQLVSEYPDNPVFERYLGRISVKKGDYYTASSIFADVFNKSNKKYPGYTDVARREATYYLGYYQRMQGKMDSAMVYFNECARLSRKIDGDKQSGFLVNSLLYIGNINDQLGERDKALTCYKELLDIKEYGQSHALAKQYIEKPYGK